MIRLFKVFIPTSVVALLLSEVILIIGCYIAPLYLSLVPYDPTSFLMDENGVWRILIVATVIILGLYFNDLYANIRIRQHIELLQQLCFTIGVAFLTQALISYVNRGWTVPKMLMIEGSTLALFFLFLWRLLYSATIWKAIGIQRVLFLGRSPIVFQVADYLTEHPELGFRPVGFLDEAADDAGHESQLACLGTTMDVVRVAKEQQPDHIVVGMSERRTRMPTYDLLDLRFSGIRIDEIARLYEITFARVCTREIRPSQLIFTEDLGPRRRNLRLQVLFSKLLALFALVISSPIMLLVALAVRLTSTGPIFFRQTRVGLQEKIFTVYKFRSMYHDAEARTGPVWATRNDPRVTPLGNWLRKLRLDELPQLFNVIAGDMSIVGPRPERPEFTQMLSAKIPYYRQRHCVMPGITGWAQINYKYGDTIEDTIMKLEYDLYYIKHASVWLDFLIMFQTAKTMLLVRGAQ